MNIKYNARNTTSTKLVNNDGYELESTHDSILNSVMRSTIVSFTSDLIDLLYGYDTNITPCDRIRRMGMISNKVRHLMLIKSKFYQYNRVLIDYSLSYRFPWSVESACGLPGMSFNRLVIYLLIDVFDKMDITLYDIYQDSSKYIHIERYSNNRHYTRYKHCLVRIIYDMITFINAKYLESKHQFITSEVLRELISHKVVKLMREGVPKLLIKKRLIDEYKEFIQMDDNVMNIIQGHINAME